MYVSPGIWVSESPEISCEAPCTLILPPFPLLASTTISWPILVTPLLVSTNGGISMTTATATVPEFEVTTIPFWPVIIASNQTSGVLNPIQSLTPLSVVLVLPGSITPLPPTAVNYTVVAEIQAAGETIVPIATKTITSPAYTTANSTPSAVVTPSPIASNMASGCINF